MGETEGDKFRKWMRGVTIYECKGCMAEFIDPLECMRHIRKCPKCVGKPSQNNIEGSD